MIVGAVGSGGVYCDSFLLFTLGTYMYVPQNIEAIAFSA